MDGEEDRQEGGNPVTIGGYSIGLAHLQTFDGLGQLLGMLETDVRDDALVGIA